MAMRLEQASWQHLRNSKLYRLVAEFAGGMSEFGRLDTRFASLKPDRRPLGNVLFCYHNEAFFLKPGETAPNRHSNLWEALQIGRTWLDLGYCVDVVNAGRNKFHPTKRYSFFIANRVNFDRISLELNEDCVKVLHIDSAHWLFHMAAVCRRLLVLQERRGVVLPLRRVVAPDSAIERASCATVLGNEFTLSTYAYANKPMYRVPISAATLYPWPEQKNWNACRSHFVWLGSGGLVNKGLDLVLESFAEMPEYRLTVCGPIDTEPDFARVFHKELYETPNIETVGWVDVSSAKFAEITHECAGMIYPSCSEGQCGAVVTCLHAGLIPIISYESGVDVDDFGFILRTCSIEEIKRKIRLVARLPLWELRDRARGAWEFARANHTRERFAAEYRESVGNILAGRVCPPSTPPKMSRSESVSRVEEATTWAHTSS